MPTVALPQTDTVVTLTVQTHKINQNNKNSKVTFSDNQGDPAENPGDPANYVSSVNKGAQITWEGVANNGVDTVNITSVVQKPGSEGGSSILQSIGSPNDGKVTAQVKNAQVTGYEYYTVNFNVIKNGVTTSYSIDPKLSMVNS